METAPSAGGPVGKARRQRTPLGASTVTRLVVAAQVLTLLTYALGLQFLLRTTGGTLFSFATLAPLLVLASTVMLVVVAVHKFRQRHSLFQLRTFQPGDYVFRQGEEADCAFFIRSGEVEVLRETGGTPEEIAKLTSGQYFGEMALLNDEPRNASVRALTPTTAAVLGKGNFLSLLSVLPATKSEILKTVSDRAQAD